ncbi:hypothetical protein GJ496_000468 [Pomphorhynchus laevis]|nr:hypothetical protein GJ496_000468 [Pomphorhynchus laevis]
MRDGRSKNSVFGMENADFGKSFNCSADVTDQENSPLRRLLFFKMAKSVILIKPEDFAFNKEAADDNIFASDTDFKENVKSDVEYEFHNLVLKLKQNKINAIVFDDLNPSLGPDVIFPNNWFSSHDDGTVIIYPMCHSSRRSERRPDIIQYLQNKFIVQNVLDLSLSESQGRFLEGTGSMVFDHDQKIVYAAISQRTDESLVLSVSKTLNYIPFTFQTMPILGGVPIYHTNVIMAVGSHYIVCCTELIEPCKVKPFLNIVKQSGKDLVDITCDQVKQFAGNIIQIRNADNELCTVMSDRAYASFTDDQLGIIAKHGRIVHSSIETIENIGGGGVRCMIAEVWLDPKN